MSKRQELIVIVHSKKKTRPGKRCCQSCLIRWWYNSSSKKALCSIDAFGTKCAFMGRMEATSPIYSAQKSQKSHGMTKPFSSLIMRDVNFTLCS